MTATPSVAGVTAVLTFQQNGKAVSLPSDIGSYDIYAAITDTNYRHVSGTDGSAMKIGTLVIYEDTAPANYKVSFNSNGGTGSTADLAAAPEGSLRTMPECGFTKEGFIFSGWKYDGKVYQLGDTLYQPASDITLTTVWGSSYAISGTVKSSGSALGVQVQRLR